MWRKISRYTASLMYAPMYIVYCAAIPKTPVPKDTDIKDKFEIASDDHLTMPRRALFMAEHVFRRERFLYSFPICLSN